MSAFMHTWGEISQNGSPLGTKLTLIWSLGADFAHIGLNLGVLVAVLPPTWPVLGPD